MKIEQKKNHIVYYLSLFTIFFFGFILITVTNYDPNLQLISLLMTSFFYVLWGIVHHSLHHDISSKIVIEYVLFAALGVLLVLSVFH